MVSEAGVRSLPDSTVRHWRRGLDAVSPEAFAAFGTVTKQQDGRLVDPRSVRKELLLGVTFGEMKATCQSQGLGDPHRLEGSI